jgi:hypothetical protein
MNITTVVLLSSTLLRNKLMFGIFIFFDGDGDASSAAVIC